jgi:hypothetical protein
LACLQIFNSKLVLASPETASDADYAAILGVIGHEVCNYHINKCGESFLKNQLPWLLLIVIKVYFLSIMQYFHNWTGNRCASHNLAIL